MTRGFLDNNKDVDSEALSARCQSFIERMQAKLESRPGYDEAIER
jgi:hypothetical protein